MAQSNSTKWLPVLIIANVVMIGITAFVLYQSMTHNRPPKYLKKGDLAKTIEVIDPAGIASTLQPQGSTKTLLFVFSTSCPACIGNIDNWNILDTTVSGSRVIGLSLDGIESTLPFVMAHSPSFDVYISRSKEFVLSYKVHSVPLTVLIDKDSKVIDSWSGVLTSDDIDEIRSLLMATNS
jgi:peroxiredoxin